MNNDAKSTADMRPWRERRAVVAAQILREQVDVVGLQEANQSTIYGSSLDYGTTQYGDLRGAVNATGAHYAVTNEASYNCLRENSNQSCVPTYRGASNSTRILYNTDTLDLLAQGSMKYAAQSAGHIDRYLAWGVFRVRATGGEFLFADTHLDSYDTTVRVAQWQRADRPGQRPPERPPGGGRRGLQHLEVLVVGRADAARDGARRLRRRAEPAVREPQRGLPRGPRTGWTRG